MSSLGEVSVSRMARKELRSRETLRSRRSLLSVLRTPSTILEEKQRLFAVLLVRDLLQIARSGYGGRNIPRASSRATHEDKHHLFSPQGKHLFFFRPNKIRATWRKSNLVTRNTLL